MGSGYPIGKQLKTVAIPGTKQIGSVVNTDGSLPTPDAPEAGPSWATDDSALFVQKATLTTDGDLYYRANGVITRLPTQGIANGWVLTASNGLPVWAVNGGGGGGTGGLLAHLVYNPAGRTDYGTTTTAWAAADSTNLSVTFTAPTSGKVVIRLSAMAWGVTNEVSLQWGVGPHGGAVVASTEAAVISAGSSQARTRVSLDCYITGLTAGSSYTYDWFFSASFNGFNVAFSAGGGVTGSAAAIMDVWAA